MLIRKATPQDAEFVAMVLMEALSRKALNEDGSLKAELAELHRQVVRLVLHEGTLYHWRHATLAVGDDGTPMGGLIAYDGARYHEMRQLTFDLFEGKPDFDPEQMEDESRAGEYYLDSLCTLPPYRRHGVGASLLRQGIADAKALGLRATLAVSPENPKAAALYAQMGFRDNGPMFIFGETYRRYCIS
ncbi:MAG: GNAT family N-acetyltransferase [Bacteroidaceae bacterium]|nr:GNAT family N-acetyltransferase [Bacteroidaceae bacterium]